MTSQASFRLPRTHRSHPFRLHQAGYSHDLEAWTSTGTLPVVVLDRLELPVRGGVLRVAAVRQTLEGRARHLAFAAWEHEHGCIVTARSGRDAHGFAAMVARLPFEVRLDACTLGLPVDARTRPPMIALHLDSLGGVFVRPRTRRTLERVPTGRGARVAAGELFRARADRAALLLLTDSAVVDVEPHVAFDDAVERVQALEVEWRAELR